MKKGDRVKVVRDVIAEYMHRDSVFIGRTGTLTTGQPIGVHLTLRDGDAPGDETPFEPSELELVEEAPQ